MTGPRDRRTARHCIRRRGFLKSALAIGGGLLSRGAAGATAYRRQPGATTATGPGRHAIRLFLCGDVMSGRAIDQIMRHRADPRLYEPYLRDARQYIWLAEARHGTIPRPVDPAYVWGDALAVLDEVGAAVRIVNLETAITVAADPWPDKGIHYRMHPRNVGLLRVAGIGCCVLANNHVLDWGYPGLRDTVRSLDAAGVGHAGAGDTQDAAAAPAVFHGDAGCRVLVFAFASPDSGVPTAWAARADRPGLSLIDADAGRALDAIQTAVARDRCDGDIVVVSIHWGGNWGYAVPGWQITVAHDLIDCGLVDIVHGHSSHHPKAIEVYRNKVIIYGCGDLINDYEGIRGHEAFRGDLGLMFFPRLARASGDLLELELVPLQMRRFRLQHATAADSDWLLNRLNREGERFGTCFQRTPAGRFALC